MAVQTQFSTDPNAIVTVNVSIVEAPTPNTYQRTGAFVVFGATTMVAGDTEYLTQYSDLNQWVLTPMQVTSATWAGGTVTVTLPAPIPGPPTVGDTFRVVIAGFTPAAYNGYFTATVTGASTFTYPVTSNPGLTTVVGTYIPHKCIELTQMAATFFGQGNEIGVWILELGYQS